MALIHLLKLTGSRVEEAEADTDLTGHINLTRLTACSKKAASGQL